MYFTKAVVIVSLALFLIVVEAQPRDHHDRRSHGGSKNGPREHKKFGGGRGGRFMATFFDDSCLPTDCSGQGEKGFAMLVDKDAECPADISKENRKAFQDVVVRPKQFCETDVSK